MKTHISLISSQAVPNLVPAMDPDMRPNRVIQVVSPDMRQRAKWLADVLKLKNIRVEQWRIDDPWDIEHVHERMLHLIDREADALASLALNVTGGTKPMSIAAYEACRFYEIPIFYVHPEQDRVIWLYPEGRPPVELADRIKLEPFLQAHGITIGQELQRSVSDPHVLEIGAEIVRQLDHFSDALKSLNWLASNSQDSMMSQRLRNDTGALADLIDLFASGDYLKRIDGKLRFKDEAARFVVNGGWLEYLVFDAVRKVRRQDAHIHDIAMGVRIHRQQNDRQIPNELDVVFLRDNRLHIIECKTRQFKGGGEGSPGAEALYRLDTLADLTGGLQARAMLVSYREIPPHDQARAKDLQIAVCSGAQLLQMQQQIRNFITS